MSAMGVNPATPLIKIVFECTVRRSDMTESFKNFWQNAEKGVEPEHWKIPTTIFSISSASHTQLPYVQSVFSYRLSENIWSSKCLSGLPWYFSEDICSNVNIFFIIIIVVNNLLCIYCCANIMFNASHEILMFNLNGTNTYSHCETSISSNYGHMNCDVNNKNQKQSYRSGPIFV